MASISERLNSGEIILLDGGVTTEIQKRGVPLNSNVWSGLTTKTHPDEVRQVHEDYIRAGSQVIQISIPLGLLIKREILNGWSSTW